MELEGRGEGVGREKDSVEKMIKYSHKKLKEQKAGKEREGKGRGR